MILFGYKTKTSSILRALCAMALGLVMLVRTDAPDKVVQILAALLATAGVVTLVSGIIRRKDGSLPLMSVNAAVDVLLGLLLFFNPGFVAGFIVKAIGVVLIIFGVLQFIVMSGTIALLGTGWLSLLLSGLAVILGVTLLLDRWENTLMSKLAGIALIYYGATELLSFWRVHKAKKEYDIRFADKTAPGPDGGTAAEEPKEEQSLSGSLALAKDAEYEKVDDGGEDAGYWTSDTSRPVDEQ